MVENNTAAGTVEADDADSNDTLALSIEGGAEVEELLDTDEEKDVYDRRLAEYSRLVDRLKAEILAGKYD